MQIELPNRVEAAIFFLAGAYIIRTALSAKFLISEDIPPTDEERERAKATPKGRIVLACLGLATCIYAAILFWRS